MKINGKKLLQMLSVLCLLVFTGLFAFPKDAQAAAAYKALDFDYDSETDTYSIVKSGKYYLTVIDGEVCISTSKDGDFESTPMQIDVFSGYSNIFSNGTSAYILQSNAIYRYVYSTGKMTKLKSLKKPKEPTYDAWSFGAVYNGRLYLSVGDKKKERYTTYCYNVKKKKLKKIKTNCLIMDQCGKYVVVREQYHLEGSKESPNPKSLWKFTSSGLKKIKTLTKSGFAAEFAGNKLYYTHFTKYSSGQKKAILYRCNANGSGKKKLGTFKAKGFLAVYGFTSKNCIVDNDKGTYRYTYSTKKKKKISYY